eukprot:3168064-Lingulodinium_polyedra.AAC.1
MATCVLVPLGTLGARSTRALSNKSRTPGFFGAPFLGHHGPRLEIWLQPKASLIRALCTRH